MKIVPIVATSLWIATSALAQESSDPAKPPPSLFPAGYLDHQALTASLKRLEAEHPERVRVGSLAKTLQGRDVWLVTVGRSRAESDPPRPAILIVANLEADHLVGSQVALGLVERLAAAEDSEVGRFLKDRVVYLVPRLNPDGVERFLRSPRSEFRTNLRPRDRDRDGRLSEDGPNDLNGDGVAARMRAKDAKATLVADEKDPRLLRRADPIKGERPVYSDYAEGIDDDGDGLIDEDPDGGVQLNRNWPHRWAEFDREAGDYPASEPEVFALIRFAFEHPEIAVVWSFGLNDNLRAEPKKPGSTLDDADLPLFAELSRLSIKADAPLKDGAAVGDATTDGSLSEWAYHQFGVVGLASRLWASPEIPEPPKGQPSPPGEGEARWLHWNDHVMGGRAFLPFVPLDHPSLGRVEVGGWRPGVRLNPPIERVAAITDAQFTYLKDLTGKLPALAVRQAKAEAKGGRIFQVSVLVENPGYLSTALAQGVRTRKAPPVLVRLKGDGIKILAGQALHRIDTLAGSGGRQEFRWLISAPEAVKSITLEVSTPKAGREIHEVIIN